MKKLLVSCCLLLVTLSLNAQQGYKIECKLDNVSAPEIYMAYHFGGKQYIKDTTKLVNGTYTFQGEESLEGGIYLIAVPPENRYFELLVDKNNQRFKVHTNSEDYNANMKVEGSKDNKMFYDYIHYLADRRKLAQELQEKMQNPDATEEEMEEYEEELEKVNAEVLARQKEITEMEGNLFVSKVLKANQEIKIPEPPLNTDGSVDSTFRYKYYKAHYFDNLDLADGRFLRTPIYERKLMSYLDKMVAPIPDSINKEIDWILAKAKEGDDPEVYRYLLSTLLNKYASSKVMGLDAIYVHIALNYYAKGEAPWTDPEQLAKIIDNAKKLAPLLIGKKAPNLELTTLGGQQTSLYNLQSKFTAVYFWDPDCGNCSKTSTALVEVYKEYKEKGLEIFGICNKTYKELAKCNEKEEEKKMEWINTADPYGLGQAHAKYYIRANPTIYLLDENKVIRYKRIDANQLKEILERELGDKS